MDKFWHRNWFSRLKKPEVELTRAKPDHGDPDVQFSLGLKFASGESAARDYVQAAEWYRKAADQGHGLAQFNLGMMYAAGQGMPRDDVKAMLLFGNAAHLGDAGAQFNLGKSHQRASFEELPKDAVESRIEAYKWFYLAAAQGYKGSETACMTLILSMTREDIADGSRRVAAFVAAKPKEARA
jgi:uncharacterized protein